MHSFRKIVVWCKNGLKSVASSRPRAILQKWGQHLFVYLLLPLMVFSCASQGARSFHLSTETIDRPLVLPAQMWQVHVPACVDFYVNQPYGEPFAWRRLITLLIPFGPRHALTDRFEFPAFPAPYIRYALRQKTELVDETIRLNGFALTIEGGMTEIHYTQLNGVGFRGGINLKAKAKISPVVWTEGEFGVGSNIDRFSSDLDAYISPTIGFQLTKNFAFAIGYIPRVQVFPDNLFGQAFDCAVYLNPNPYFGAELGGYAFNHHLYWHIQPRLAVSFQW